MATKLKPAIFTANDPTAPRVCPELACEIGLNESMILLQLEFWIRLSGKKQKDGRFWIYESLTDFREIFPFLSTATINRAIHSLEEKKLIHVDNFNALKFDRTRWFALNAQEIAKLESVRIVTGWAFACDSSISQNDTRTNQNDTSSAQNDTTIPDLSSDLSSENYTPSSGEKLQKDAESFGDLFPETEPTPTRTKEQILEGLQSIAGADPLSGALKAKETASEKPTTIPAAAGGADPWEKVADMFCGLHGIRLTDVSESDRRNWPRKLESIAEGQRVTPAQMIEAIRTIPEPQSGIDWKVTGSYSSPYSKTFEGDIKILLAKIATGQIEPKGAPQPAVSPLAKAGYDVEAIRKAAERMAADD
jgi:hypothetical protein